MLAHRLLAEVARLPVPGLRSADSRRLAEAGFVGAVEPLLAALPATLAACASDFAIADQGQDELLHAVTELSAGGEDASLASFHPRLMRIVLLPTVEDLKIAFRTDGSLPARFPLMVELLKPRTTTTLVRASCCHNPAGRPLARTQ